MKIQIDANNVYPHHYLLESLTVSISDAKKQYVYEVTGGAKFEKGGCGGKRISNLPKVVLKMPVAGDEDGNYCYIAFIIIRIIMAVLPNFITPLISLF